MGSSAADWAPLEITSYFDEWGRLKRNMAAMFNIGASRKRTVFWVHRSITMLRLSAIIPTPYSPAALHFLDHVAPCAGSGHPGWARSQLDARGTGDLLTKPEELPILFLGVP